MYIYIEIQPTFYQMVCPCCFTFFIPGTNCIQRFYTIKRIRRFKQKKHESKSRIKCIIFSSQLLNSSERISRKRREDKDSLFSTFECKACKTMIVYDSYPLELLENLPEQHQVKPSNPPKKESLQKVLQKSQIPKRNDSEKKEMDLESFLQGFL
jgi:hypothetical protein